MSVRGFRPGGLEHRRLVATINRGRGQRATLAQIDHEYKQIGTLGHGGFGHVFLAEKRSERKVVLKFFDVEYQPPSTDAQQQHEDDDDDGKLDSFRREMNALLKLNKEDDSGEQRDLSIVFLENWYHGPGYCCLVMSYVDGGTLAQDIAARRDANNPEPYYFERRIAFYVLQLLAALAFAHERGVMHHDVNSANVLIDRSDGGKLLLADLGSSVAPGEESVVFTELYASPELLEAQAQDDYSNICAKKVDSFGLGCIIFELLACRKLGDLPGEETLAERITENGLEAALASDRIRLPWLPTEEGKMGYSGELKMLASLLLEPDPENRWVPSDLQEALRNHARSPLLANHVAAAATPVAGAPVTVDNVQLGMLVQRGDNWNDGDEDGGLGSVGVVVKLDADADYTQVAWPSPSQNNNNDNTGSAGEPMTYRIGAKHKFELKAVGPLEDFIWGTKEKLWYGIYPCVNIPCIGTTINKGVVVAARSDQQIVLVAPKEKKESVPTLPADPVVQRDVPRTLPRQLQGPPDCWTTTQQGCQLVTLTDPAEKKRVLKLFYAVDGGLDIQTFKLVSVQRVESVEMWNDYAQAREEVASENWGIPNERQAFVGTKEVPPESFLRDHSNSPRDLFTTVAADQQDDGNLALSKQVTHADQNCFVSRLDGTRQIILARVSLGRQRPEFSVGHDPDPPTPWEDLEYHSTPKVDQSGGKVISLDNPRQAFPEYIVTYKQTPPTKRCVVCMDNPVNRVLVPCGHPCLCQICATEENLVRMNNKCPVCRSTFQRAMTFYGRVVED